MALIPMLEKSFQHVLVTGANSQINIYWNLVSTVAVESLFKGLFILNRMFYSIVSSFQVYMKTLGRPWRKCVLDAGLDQAVNFVSHCRIAFRGKDGGNGLLCLSWTASLKIL